MSNLCLQTIDALRATRESENALLPVTSILHRRSPHRVQPVSTFSMSFSCISMETMKYKCASRTSSPGSRSTWSRLPQQCPDAAPRYALNASNRLSQSASLVLKVSSLQMSFVSMLASTSGVLRSRAHLTPLHLRLFWRLLPPLALHRGQGDTALHQPPWFLLAVCEALHNSTFTFSTFNP